MTRTPRSTADTARSASGAPTTGPRVASSPPPPVPTDPEPGTCPAGTFRLEDRCARGCDAGCVGGVCMTTVEDVPFCAPVIASCADIPTKCTSHEQCGAQEFCAPIGFCRSTDPVISRCVP